jgi:hypothetical protein
MAKRAVDLDKTLAYAERGATTKYGYDPYHVGKPIQAMVDKVIKWLQDGDEVIIFTARDTDDPKTKLMIQEWSERHVGKVLEVTNKKLPDVDYFYDDKAVTVEINTGRILGVEQV